MQTTVLPYIIGAVVVLVISAVLFLLLRREGPPPYRRAALFTAYETAFYRELHRFAERRELLLFAKVRMADLLTVTAKPKKYQGWFNKISQKHADFVLCDPGSLDVLAVVELDDRSHERPDRRERDKFVDSAYGAAGIPIVHVREERGRALEELLLRACKKSGIAAR